MEKVEERNEKTASALLQMMQQMSQQDNHVQQQPSRVMPSVSQAAGTPQQEPPIYTTATMVQSLNNIQLTEKAPSAKKQKQHDEMDHHQEHPILNGGPQTADNNRNSSQLPPTGGEH